MDTQLKKGVLELCVMCLLSEKDMYGYELVSEISEVMEISEGSIYPLLKRIKDDSLVTTYLAESQGGPPRKYYSITKAGRGKKEILITNWRKFADGVDRICKFQGGVQQ